MAEGNRTEKATPKKRRDQRKKGNVFLSNDAVAVATLIAGYLVLRVAMGGALKRLKDLLSYCFQLAGGLAVGGVAEHLPEILKRAVFTVAATVGPVMLVVAFTAVAATFFQTKLLVSPESIQPKFSRVNPLEGFKRLFSLRSVIEALKGIIKIAILLYLVYSFLKCCLVSVDNYLGMDISAACADVLGRFSSLLLEIIIAFVAVAAFDFFYQWWDYERQMRMTKQEVKEEYKQTEGDPQVKGKIREIQRRMAQTRMMQQVPQADVVIRNPTHVAVALRYRPEQDNAPVVLAMGLDELALRIVQVAEENQISVVENVAVARALYASAELNREIPPELYGAVADVLVYLYRMNGTL